jgi:cytochrome c oxidase assembly factor 5
MSSSCRTLIEAFHDCVLNSPCVKKDGRLPSDCLRNEREGLPEACQSLRKATYDCKRGMVCFLTVPGTHMMMAPTHGHAQLDMRKRFRGNNVSMPEYKRPSDSISDNDGTS